jgi:hypothetical protein
MPKLRKLKYKQRGGVKVSFLQPNGTYVATEDNLDIIHAIFQNCIDTYLISASSASGTVFGVALPQPGPGVDPPILLRANQLNPDGSFRTQDQLADRARFVGDGLIITDCCIKMSFVGTTSNYADVFVLTHTKRTCVQSELDKEVRVQGEIFSSTLCGTTAPLTFTPDKIAATTMTAGEFGRIVTALATRNPNPPPHVASAIGMLRAIQLGAHARGLRIHIFVMDLLTGETLRTIITRPGTTLQEKRAACNNVAISVIMTFLKSLYWSRDQHADNAMISGPNAFTLDYGLMYHLIADEVYIKKTLLESLLSSPNIPLNDVCKYFGVFTNVSMNKLYAQGAVQYAFNGVYAMLKDPNLKQRMVINSAAVTPAAIAVEIDRISGIVFQMLSFFLLVDGLSNRYKHGVHHFQSREYMEVVFDSLPPAVTLNSFVQFLSRGSINLSVFGGPPGSAVRANMRSIVQGLQTALAICQGQGPARNPSTLRLSSQSSSSPGELAEAARLRSVAAASAVPGRLSRFTGAVRGAVNAGIDRVTKWWWPGPDPNRGGGTVKRRVRAQKRQKQTMRPCNIRRRQRRRSFK